MTDIRFNLLYWFIFVVNKVVFKFISDETNARLHRIETLLTAEAENIKNRLFQLESILFDNNTIRYHNFLKII